jgi:hypothetical protein
MTPEASWTTPDEARAEVQRLWERGRILAAGIEGESLFPLHLRLRRPDSREMSERFDDVRRWIRALEDGAKPTHGSGYEIIWTEVGHRQLGRNRIPDALVVSTRDDALRWINRRRQGERFDALAAATCDRFPALRTWVAKKPLLLTELADDWDRMLAVLAWFRDHPRAGIYLRQVDIPGVDTKFIERHKGLCIELLDLVLPSEVVNVSAGRQIELRYGLRPKPPLVRFRIVDPRHRIGGLSDIATPASQFAELALRVRRIFVTENEINGLAFPDIADSAVIFGLGYSLERLIEVPWLAEKAIHYWGDIDTHGFAILSRLRGSFPCVRSLLMDRETLLAHRHLWVEETARHLTPLAHLTPDETALYEDLAADRLGRSIRLEQERIAFGWLERALERLDAP